MRLNKTKLKSLFVMVIGAFVTLCYSCNKEFPNVLRENYPDDEANSNFNEKKVLLIILDGVKGRVVESMSPLNITQLRRRAVFDYNGIADAKAGAITNETAWANMFTGVTNDKHQVTGNSLATADLTNYPTLFTRIKSIKSSFRTALIGSSSSLVTAFGSDATFSTTTANDDAKVKDATLAELNTEKAGLVVAQFHGADIAGANGGYTATNPAYTGAITLLDTYIGELVNAVNNRTWAKDENWLIVITSNKGGADPSDSSPDNAFVDQSRNTFTMFYNPRFLSLSVPKPDVSTLPYVGYAPRFVSTESGTVIAEVVGNTSVGNFGSSGDFTLMYKFRNDHTAASYYPTFMGKRNPFNSVSSVGWGFLLGANSAQLDYSGSPRPGFGKDIRDGIWHTVAVKFFNTTGTRQISLFIDGLKVRTDNIAAKNADNTTPLRIGADRAGDGNGRINLLIKDLAIYNVAMSDDDLIKNMRNQLTPTSPYFTNLLGWWPADERNGDLIEDKSGKGNDMKVKEGVLNRFAFEDLSPNITPQTSEKTFKAVVNNVDVPFQILNWLGIPVVDNWKLDGKVWKPNYTDLRK